MTPTEIGFIGAGGIATALARHFVRVGTQVVLSNSRGPASLVDVVHQLGPTARAGTTRDAVEAPVVVLAVPWNRIESALAGLAPWRDQVVIDTTNPIWAPEFKPADLGGRTSSEVVADMVPGARLVKAFNTLPPPTLAADPHHNDGRRVIFVSGDHPTANTTIAALAEHVGFAPIILGPLATGGALQQFPGGPLPALNLVQLP